MTQDVLYRNAGSPAAGGFTLSRPFLFAAFFTLSVYSSAWADAHWDVQHQTGDDSRCVLQSETVPVYDGFQDSTATLVSLPSALYVESKSVLDPSFGDIGMQIDHLAFIPMDGIEDRHRVIFTSHYDDIVAQFKAGREVRIHLRFWPTWPAQGLFLARFSLMGFTKAYEELLRCQ